MKKIYIDGLGLVEGHFSGVGQYILGIIQGLDKIIDEAKNRGERTPSIEVIIPYNTVNKFNEFGFKNISYKRFPLSFRYMSALWHRGKLPPIDLWCGKGKYIFPRFVDMPLLFSESNIVIHDISYEKHKEFVDEGNSKFLSVGTLRSVKKAKRIIVNSNFTKSEINSFYGVPPENIVVSRAAVDQTHFYRRSNKEITGAKLKYGIKAKNYVLALSNLEPRKNLELLVDCYCNLPASLRKDTALLLVGVNGWKADRLFEKIMKKVQEGYNIIRPNSYVSDEDKPAIISGASMLVYPSHYEGFGIPPLEALACGVPVITSDNSSLPEVVGEAGKMIPSKDSKKLLEAMVDYLNNIDEYTKRAKIEGPRRAEQFSWKKSAEVYYNILIKDIKTKDY